LPDDALPLKNADSLRKNPTVSAKHYPVQKMEEVVSVVGAGDCLAGAFIASLLRGLGQAFTLNLSNYSGSLRHQ